MATVRIFLLTCRRPALLPRALASLRAQTFTDWICELHNDAPEDDFPRRLVAETGDPRITLHHHEKNLGAVAVFNRACSPPPEPFFSILEDDNWWEPAFLEKLLATLRAYPEAELAWANLRFWQEEASGHWTDLGRTLWPEVPIAVVPIATPQLIQFDGPLHSNGSLVARASAATAGRLQVPPWVPFACMENLRERAFRSPWLLVPEPLVNYALTRATARRAPLADWMGQQAMLAKVFLQYIRPSRDEAARLWQSRREARPRATGLLFFAALLAGDLRFLRHATSRDWLGFLAGLIRHPWLACTVLGRQKSRRELEAAFARATQELAASINAPLPAGCIAPLQLAGPQDLTRAMTSRGNRRDSPDA